MFRSLLLAAALVAVTACTAPAASSDSSSTDLSKGSKGATGPTGPMGPKGPTGATGATGPSDGLLPQSGTRLRAMRQVSTGDDGSQEQSWDTSFWDSKLNAQCS